MELFITSQTFLKTAVAFLPLAIAGVPPQPSYCRFYDQQLKRWVWSA